MSEEQQEALKYAIKKEWFTEEQIETKQKEYEEKRIIETKAIIEAIGSKIIAETLDSNQP